MKRVLASEPVQLIVSIFAGCALVLSLTLMLDLATFKMYDVTNETLLAAILLCIPISIMNMMLRVALSNEEATHMAKRMKYEVDENGAISYECPCCKIKYNRFYKGTNFCQECGQKIKW